MDKKLPEATSTSKDPLWAGEARPQIFSPEALSAAPAPPEATRHSHKYAVRLAAQLAILRALTGPGNSQRSTET
jgi:hypothetical protein